jgi:hypothetical protein
MKRLLLTLILTLTVLVGSLRAQEVPTLSSLEISLWPEYDRPGVLVMYRGLLSADTPLPVQVDIRIPARVGQPSAMAYVGEGGQRFNQEYTTRIEDDWLVVSFELATLGFQLEYYDELSVDSTGKRQYEFDFVADYDTAELNLEFQVPPTAEGFVLEPFADSVVQQGDGLTYHLVQVGPLEQGDTKSWSLTYQKSGSELTVSASAQSVTPAPLAPVSSDATDNSTVLIFLVAFVALIGVGAGAFWLGRRTQPLSESLPAASRPQGLQAGPRKRRGSGRGTQSQRQPSPPDSGSAMAFCHQCGAELRSDADFCHKCGAAVRIK